MKDFPPQRSQPIPPPVPPQRLIKEPRPGAAIDPVGPDAWTEGGGGDAKVSVCPGGCVRARRATSGGEMSGYTLGRTGGNLAGQVAQGNKQSIIQNA